MAKELPYFQFEPAEYLTGDIQFCSLEAQGLFNNIISMYWQRQCELTFTKIERKFKSNLEALDELIREGIIKVYEGDLVSIEFLDRQYAERIESKKRLSEAGRKGAKIKKDKATLKPPLSEASTTLKQPEEIRRDKKRVDNTKEIYREFKHLKLTLEEFNRVSKVYDKEDIDNCLDSIENHTKNINYTSLNLTLQNWLKRSYKTRVDKIEKPISQASPDFNSYENVPIPNEAKEWEKTRIKQNRP